MTFLVGDHDDFHQEKNDLLNTALEISPYIQVDDTGASHDGKWKEPQDNGMEGSQLGFIAQEVEEALPEAVLTQENEEQTKGLKYNAFIPVLTKAVQALAEENEALRAENKALDVRLARLEALLNAAQ